MMLEGRNAIVTGASRGLGAAIARALAREGANLLLVSRSGTGVTADLAEPRAAERVIAEARRHWDRLDILVNNAGVLGPMGPSWENPSDEWRRTMQVNLLAPVELCRLAVPWMRDSGGGSIINVSGGGATGPRPNFSAYACAKTALVRFTEVLAQEAAGFGVRVNAIAPGAMNTAMHRAVLDAGPERAGAGEYQRAVEQERSGGTSPDKAAELAVFLASDASAGVSGRLLSALWDPWPRLAEHAEELRGSDIYTLRRIVPDERGKDWK